MGGSFAVPSEEGVGRDAQSAEEARQEGEGDPPVHLRLTCSGLLRTRHQPSVADLCAHVWLNEAQERRESFIHMEWVQQGRPHLVRKLWPLVVEHIEGRLTVALFRVFLAIAVDSVLVAGELINHGSSVASGTDRTRHTTRPEQRYYFETHTSASRW